MATTPLLAALASAALIAAPGLALAQPAKVDKDKGLTYRCTAKDGKKHYGSTVPKQCAGQPLELLNAQGLVVRRIDAAGDEKERAAKEADTAKKREFDAAAKEEARRNRALLATYTSERDIEEARRRALEENQKTIGEIERRLDGIRKDQARLSKEMEFYTGKNKPPAKLQEEIASAERDLKGQTQMLDAKKKEVTSINGKYDDDKKRFVDLTKKK